jgi:5'-nucleotidase
LILGGHTHTFLPEPQSFINKSGKNVLVNQVGFAGLLGQIDFYFDKNKSVKNISWNNQVIDDRILVKIMKKLFSILVSMFFFVFSIWQ